MPGRGKLETFAPRDVPSPLGTKLAVLRLFTRCMQQQLREVRAWQGRAGLGKWGQPLAGGESQSRRAGLSAGRGPAHARPARGPRPLPAALPGLGAGFAAAVQ